MSYDAFTIDTNVPKQYGLQLKSGLMAQLQQFKDGHLEFILSDVVIREIYKHLDAQVKEANEGLKSALEKAAKAQLTGTEQADWNAKFDALPSPKEVSQARLKDFMQSTGASQIGANLASVDGLLDRYFNTGAPFDATGTKKHEFPDAIALLSLEAWAKKEEKRILAVSTDKGWKAFAEKSDRIDVLEDLATALGVVQQHAEAAQEAITKLLGSVTSGNSSPFSITLNQMLETSLADTQFDVEGHGYNCRDGDSEGLQLISFMIDENHGGFEISIVRLGSSVVVAAVGLTVLATALASFSMAVWDSIDKEEISMGYQSAHREIEFQTNVLITFYAAEKEDNTELEIVAAEVVDGPGTVNFGEIELDLGDDGYEEWPDFEDEVHPKIP